LLCEFAAAVIRRHDKGCAESAAPHTTAGSWLTHCCFAKSALDARQVLLGIIVFMRFEDRVEDAKWLSPDEKQLLRSKLDGDAKKAVSHSFLGALRTPAFLIRSGLFPCSDRFIRDELLDAPAYPFVRHSRLDHDRPVDCFTLLFRWN
jgi:hypothetical protein